MKQRRIKKLVKGHLNKIENDGTPSFETKQQKIDQLAALNAMSNADLINALGITNAGKPGLEVVNIDGDAGAGGNPAVDAFPFDAREVADSDASGIADNKQIVDLHVELLAIAQDAALDPDRVVDAGALLGDIQTELQNATNASDGQVGENVGAFNTAVTAFNGLVTQLETLQGNADAKRARALEIHLEMSGLPAPVANIEYTVGNTTYDALTVWSSRDGDKDAIVLLANNIDGNCGLGGDPLRVADAERTAMANLIENSTPDGQ